MMTDRAIFRMTRYYMHALRQQPPKTQDECIDIAVAQTLDEMRELIKVDKSVDELTKQQVWLEVMGTIRQFSQGIKLLPIDTTSIPANTGLQGVIKDADKAEKIDPIKGNTNPSIKV